MTDEQWIKQYAESFSATLPEPVEGQIDLIRILAEDPTNGLREIAPGVFVADRTGGWSAR